MERNSGPVRTPAPGQLIEPTDRELLVTFLKKFEEHAHADRTDFADLREKFKTATRWQTVILTFAIGVAEVLHVLFFG